MNLKLPPGRYYGETIRNHDVAGFGLTETIYPTHCKLPEHSHELPYFGLILQGIYNENYGRKTRVCQPYMLVYHPTGEVHSQHFRQAGGRLFRIEICLQSMERLGGCVLVRDQSADFQGNAPCRLAARLYYEFREMDEVSPLVIEGLALEMIGEVLRSSVGAPQPSPPRWLKQARELIRECSNERLTLSRIAQAAGVHPVYLSREFRRHYHCTVGEYIRHLRIETACREILRPDASLAEVALACGFHDQSHFSKIFKRVMNTTPAAYRARFRSH
jgi:AraC family transcriptional regulator